jgi:hypothetical protein
MIPRERAPFSAMVDRPKLTLPNGNRIIIWTIMNLEVWDIPTGLRRPISEDAADRAIVFRAPNRRRRSTSHPRLLRFPDEITQAPRSHRHGVDLDPERPQRVLDRRADCGRRAHPAAFAAAFDTELRIR